MRIVLIAPGYTPFPPKGWGAVESIVWDYYENLQKRQYDVHIVNQSNTTNIIQETNQLNPDVVHIMYDDYIVVAPHLNCSTILYTSHYAYITHPNFENEHRGYFYSHFCQVLQNKDRVIINAISEEIKQVYVKYGFPPERIQVICNGAREDLFRYSNDPKCPHKSIYLAKIERRKSQYKYQQIPNIDFVGNYQDSPFNTQSPHYLGEWNKETLYENMTDYGNLVLLSEGEADPLVVKEALMAGLGVVLSECSAANLDLGRSFITVIPNDKLHDIGYVSRVISLNREASVVCRQEIRQYALDHFAWDRVLDIYCENCL